MRYMMLIYDREKEMAGKSQEELGAIMDAWFKCTNDLQQSGKLLGGDALQPTPAATTVRSNGGKPPIADGPFAETKEQLGGYYLVEANDLDELIEWAGKMPHVPAGGAVEVRPLMEFDKP